MYMKYMKLPSHLYDKLDNVNNAIIAWDNILNDRLSYVLKNIISRPLCKYRDSYVTESNIPSNIAKQYICFGAFSNNKPDSFSSSKEFYSNRKIGPLYSIQDLFEAIISIKSTNAVRQVANLAAIQLELNVPDIISLRNCYKSLDPVKRSFSLDSNNLDGDWYRNGKLKLGELLVAHFQENPNEKEKESSTSANSQAKNHISNNGGILLLEQFAKSGIPPSLRKTFYSILLNCKDSETNSNYFSELMESLKKWDCATDDLFVSQVKLCSDDEQYFIFDKHLEQLMLAFSRDYLFRASCSLPLKATASTKFNPVFNTSNEPIEPSLLQCVPSCGVLPFPSQVCYIAPLCYVFDNPETIYPIFRKFYSRYFIRLHTLSSMPNTILWLSTLFEQLLLSKAPFVYLHCSQRGVIPLQLVFPWLVNAFSCCNLPASEILNIWDLIISFDSLEILAVLSAAIFCFRYNLIIKCENAQDLKDLFADLSTMKPIPLLQSFLFC